MSPRQAQKAPAFQLYPKDLLSDANVLAMDLREFGAYVKLLLICWNEYGVPQDFDRVARMIGCSRTDFDTLWVPIAHCFYQDCDGKWQQKRLDSERAKQRKFRKQRKIAADTRWKKVQDSRNADALHVQSLASSSSSATTSSSSSAEIEKAGGGDADARSKRPIFRGSRFTVFEWMLDDLRKLLGQHVDAFDLHTWFFTLDAKATAEGFVVPQRDGGKWLLAQTQNEALRRGLFLDSAASVGTGKTAGNAAAIARFIARGGGAS